MSVTEIAKLAGVSIATVSRVLNKDPRVRPETAAQVEKVLRDIPYDHNAVRRGPRVGKRVQKRSGSILVASVGAVQSEMFLRPVNATVVAGITRAASAQGLNVLIDEMLDPSRLPPAVISESVEGCLIFVQSTTDPAILAALRRHVPVVRVLGEELKTPDVDQVRPDNLAIGQLAFQNLAERGCKRIAFVTTRPDHEVFYLRGTGFVMAAARMGVQPSAFIAGKPLVTGDFCNMLTRRSGTLEEIADQIAAADQRPDGIFVSHDPETIGIYPMLAQRGIRPGRDIEIISCNNEVRALAMLSPRPVSIDIGTAEIGRLAVNRLVNRIARPHDPPMRMLVAPTLS